MGDGQPLGFAPETCDRIRNYWKRTTDPVMGNHGTMPVAVCGPSDGGPLGELVVKDSEGLFFGVIVITKDADGDQTVTVHDNDSGAAGDYIAQVYNVETTAGHQINYFPQFPIHCETGISVGIGQDAYVYVFYK